jgi:hypothetical protein
MIIGAEERRQNSKLNNKRSSDRTKGHDPVSHLVVTTKHVKAISDPAISTSEEGDHVGAVEGV